MTKFQEFIVTLLQLNANLFKSVFRIIFPKSRGIRAKISATLSMRHCAFNCLITLNFVINTHVTISIINLKLRNRGFYYDFLSHTDITLDTIRTRTMQFQDSQNAFDAPFRGSVHMELLLLVP